MGYTYNLTLEYQLNKCVNYYNRYLAGDSIEPKSIFTYLKIEIIKFNYSKFPYKNKYELIKELLTGNICVCYKKY